MFERNVRITPQENAQLLHRDEILAGFGKATHKIILQIPNGGFAEAPLAVDGADSRALQGSLCLWCGVFGIGARKRMLKSNFGGHEFAGMSSVSSLGKRRDWVLQVAEILGMCGGW